MNETCYFFTISMLKKILQKGGLGKNEAIVLYEATLKVDNPKEPIRLVLSDIVEKYNTHLPTISNAKKMLEKKGFLIKQGNKYLVNLN